MSGPDKKTTPEDPKQGQNEFEERLKVTTEEETFRKRLHQTVKEWKIR